MSLLRLCLPCIEPTLRHNTPDRPAEEILVNELGHGCRKILGSKDNVPNFNILDDRSEREYGLSRMEISNVQNLKRAPLAKAYRGVPSWCIKLACRKLFDGEYSVSISDSQCPSA